MIDAALAHLIESKANTSVLRVHYRRSIIGLARVFVRVLITSTGNTPAFDTLALPNILYICPGVTTNFNIRQGVDRGMAPGFTYSKIGTWLGDLPDGLVASIGQLSDPPAAFGFAVRAETAEVHVLIPEDGPLVIESTVSFGEAVLSAIRRRPARFFTEANPIMTSAPGFYRYTDGEGNAADAESFSAVVLRHHVYSTGGDKHAVLTGVIDLLTATKHLQTTGDRLVDAAGKSW